jgi:type II secretory pathway component PulJ
MPTRLPTGYTLIELVVALFLFTLGGLALVATSAVIGRELSANATRERAARSAATRLEILAAECRAATGGRETSGGIESEWSVAFPDSFRVSLVDAVTYSTQSGAHTDLSRVTLPCRP